MNELVELVEEFPGRTRQIETLINWFGEVSNIAIVLSTEILNFV
jgi:hypothetical protein